jgi:type VI secretion system secreted protein VgrG
VAAGAHILKADNVVFEGEAIVSFVMGASTITLTPASISIAGVSIKIDGATAETAALILDN